MKKILFLIVFLYKIICLAQAGIELPNAAPPTPNTFAFNKNYDIPIGKFTGTPNVNIPIYSIKSGQLQSSANLTYSSNGIKVDEYSGIVGMGWSLSVGGMITRTVNDDPDENTQVYPPDFETPEDYEDLADFLQFYSVHQGKHLDPDYNPDIFSFNFNGFHGKFIIEREAYTSITNRSIKQLQPSTLKIEILTSLNNNNNDGDNFDFKITDGNGFNIFLEVT